MSDDTPMIGREVPEATRLYPTRTRLQLLEDVRDGYVLNGGPTLDEDMQGHSWLVHPQYPPPQKVSWRIAELERAGWVHLPEPEIDWRLTPAGERVLAEHQGGTDER